MRGNTIKYLKIANAYHDIHNRPKFVQERTIASLFHTVEIKRLSPFETKRLLLSANHATSTSNIKQQQNMFLAILVTIHEYHRNTWLHTFIISSRFLFFLATVQQI